MWHHGGDILSVQRSNYVEKLVDFSANINPLGQPISVRNAILESADKCLNYPDPFCRELKHAISNLEGVNEEYIVCGNGAAEIIFNIAYSLKPKSALIIAPTFSEYEQAVSQVGCKVNYFYLKQDTDFIIDDSILQSIKNNDVIFICNPNNPVGNICDVNLIECILKECVKYGTTLVIDECFMDLVENSCSSKDLLDVYSNLIIIKAFTKSFAIPGIRLGYCMCSDYSICSMIEKTGPPWSVSIPAQLAGIAACGEKEFLDRSVKYICNEREFLNNNLIDNGFTVYESETNFIMFYCEDDYLRDKLIEKKGIIIRDCSNYVGLSKGFYRVAVRTHKENEYLIKNLRQIL